jgi:hypothetical protein
VLETLGPTTEGPRAELAARARRILAAAATDSAPVATKSATLAALRDIERARLARGPENPKTHSTLDPHDELARHAAQVCELLAQARRSDPGVELPAELISFVEDVGVACGRARDFERAYAYALPAARNAGDDRLFERLLEEGRREMPDSPPILSAILEDQLSRQDPAALATADRLVALARTDEDRRGRLRDRARAFLYARRDPRAALEEFRGLRGSTDWTRNDDRDDMIVAAKAYIELRDKVMARRVLDAAQQAIVHEEAASAQRKAIENLVRELDALGD